MRQCGSRGSCTGPQQPSNACKEVRYPFGVQNDLGHVQIPPQKNKAESLLGSGGRSTPVGGVSTPPTLWRTPQIHRQSTPSLQSTSLQCSYASSCDLTADALMLERAIRANDALRVKRFLNVHHDKFQVNLHGSLLGKSSSDGSQSGDVEILLRKSKTLIDRIEPVESTKRTSSPINSSRSSCSSDSSSSISSGGAGEIPLVFSNALHMAVEYGSVDVLRILLKYGLEPNQGGRIPAGCIVEPPAPVPQPSSPTTTSPTRTSLTGGLSEPSPVTTSLPSAPSGLPTTGSMGGGPSRRVSWVSAIKPERRRRATFKALSRQSTCSRHTLCSPACAWEPRPPFYSSLSQPPAQPLHGKASLARRSFSLESNSEMLRPWVGERRSVSLKSSPLVSPKPPMGNQVSEPAPAPPDSPKERSIFAELRRSSEIFKSILLNLSMKEQEIEEDGVDPPSPSMIEPQIDVAELLSAHERFRLQEDELTSDSSGSSSSCESSLSSSDDDLETEVNPRQEIEIEANSRLRVNPNLPSDKSIGLCDIYSRPYLLTLPVLFLAVVRGNPTIVYLLLKYGASVNFQDTHGNTALHLAVSRDCVPWDCVVELIENGAQIALGNRRGVTPSHLAPAGLLTNLQQNMINNSWPEPGQEAAACPPKGTPARILKKLRSNKGESGEEGSYASGGEQREISSTGSTRSSLNRSPDLSKEGVEGKKRDCENRKSRGKRKWRDSTRERQASSVSEKVAAPPINTLRGFHVLLQMSSNPEVLGFILRGLLAQISKLLKLLQQRNDQQLHRNMAALVHKLLKTSLETYGGPSLVSASGAEAEKRKVELSAACCLLLKTCLTLIHGVHDLQFTAMVTINKVIDTCVVYRLAHMKVKVSEALQHPAITPEKFVGLKESAEELETKNGTKRTKGKATKRLGSVWRHAAGEHLEQVRRTLAAEIVEHDESVIDVLSSVHAMSVLNILHNALTLYKRVIGSKQQCTPSQRWRHCSYHCLQLLAARALLFMVEGTTVQSQLAQEPQLRILAAALDSTHDPQLLVLVLQIVATLAMDPSNHRALTDQGLPDVLSQLLLPSDEWYYTNHSTKYARFVKHHVARILVYLGFQHRVNLRFSVYDILQDDAPPPTPLLESVEDNYIINTSAPPSSVSCAQTRALLGVSVESAVLCVLKAIESSLSQAGATDNTTLQWVLSGHSYYSHTMSLIQHQERRVPQDPSSSGFVQCFLACYPCVLSPVILLRLLLHRMLTTAAHLQRWKSCTSRSSFASVAHEVPRSPRSRASSTDTEPSTLRNRRKVNLTVDCTGFGSEHGTTTTTTTATTTTTIHRPLERIGSLVPRDSIGSASGLEPAMQAIFAFSHILRTRSKESLHSGESSDGRLSPSEFLPLAAAFNLHHHQKTRSSFRFSSLRHSNKQRSKSHANITKVLHNTDSVGRRDTPEQEILAFQKQLQNLPDFDSPEGATGGILGPEAMEKPLLRPRSRSMPRVTYEGSRYLTLPEHSWAKIPRGRSAGALGLQVDHHPPTANLLPSPVSTPVEERRVSNGVIQQGSVSTTAGASSRRSSLSPSDRANRRRDSPACVGLEIPPWHRAILNFIEEWLRVSRVELERNPAVCRELRDVMAKISPLGTPYQQWCAEFRQEFPVLVKDPDLESADDLEETNKEYCHLLQLVVGGELPCSKEEAASLAGIQLRIEETWGRPHGPTSPDDNTLKTISEDKESFLLPVPTFGGNMARPVSPLVEEAETEENEGKSLCGERTPVGVATTPAPPSAVSKGHSLLRKCYPTSTQQVPFMPSGHLEDCLPPCYHGTKAMAKLVKEHKRKLFHTSIYESELQLKKLYIQTCRRLPVHGCNIYPVKELLRGKTKKKASRILGLGPDRIVLLDSKTKILAKSQNTADLLQWQQCGGRSHDRLQLEFRGTRWSLVVPSPSAMRDVGRALWTILQDLDSHFLDEYALTRTPVHCVLKGRGLEVGDSAELEGLQRLLHFPEEVSLRLAQEEDSLFYQVPPIDYLRQVTLDLGGTPPPPPHPSHHDPSRASVRSLIKRFNEVSSWVTHLIISQPTHEDRKAVLSCILRVALSCWNIGNFNGAMEIVAGLKSNKLKPFWLSITEKEPVPILDFLSAALLSVEYERALGRALSMPECRVVPFFGAFLRDLRDILSTTPSLVVLAPAGDRTQLEFISDYNGEDHYFTRIGPGGLINLDKIYKTQAVMDKIASFHQHYHARVRDIDTLREQFSSIHTVSIERPYMTEETEETDNEMDSYKPVQSLSNDHGVSFFPISSPSSGLNHHVLQTLHHGSTAVHWEGEGCRSCLVYVRLERSCSLLSWTRPAWSGLRTASAQGPDYNLGANPEEQVCGKWTGAGVCETGLEEGCLELACVKEITVGPRDKENPDLSNTLRRYGLDGYHVNDVCLALVYGQNLSDNRILFLLSPPTLCRLWYSGLSCVVKGLKRHLQSSDRRMFWLKEQYLQLFYEENNCSGPMTVDAIRVFGGRDWANTGHITGMSPPDNGTLRRGPSAKFKKKRSIGNIQTLKPETCREAAEIATMSYHQRRALPSPAALPPCPSRSRSISSDMEARPGASPQGSSDHLDSSSPTHHHRERVKKDIIWPVGHFRHGSITHETQLDFVDFVALFRSFSLRSRKDLKDLFDQFAMSCRSMSDSSLNDGSLKSSPEHSGRAPKIGLLTRNSSADLVDYKNTPAMQKKKIFDAIATSSIVSNCAGVDTSKSQVITLNNFSKFLETKQLEQRTEEEVKDLIQRHEPDPTLRSHNCLSFEGFARFLMDKENFAFVNEKVAPDERKMDYPLSHYYIASSHNTYLTGHQLKGESSVDLYSQVLLTGCRCVELDCYDGDDGSPLIYHGHTFTTKIAFKSVVEAINRSAFVTSPYPVILSIENHCSVQQQGRMAQIFQSVFGDKLVAKFIFEADFSDEPCLPSPGQLKYRILIKNKKLTAEIAPPFPLVRGGMGGGKSRTGHTLPPSGRASSIISNTSGGSVNDEFSDDDDDDVSEDEDNIDAPTECPRTDSLSSHDSALKTPSKSMGRINIPGDIDWSLIEDAENAHKASAKKQSSQIARELSDLVVYIQAIKFRGLNAISPNSSIRCKRAAAVAAVTSSAMLKKNSGASLTSGIVTGSPSSSDTHSNHPKGRVNTAHPCYQCSSLNENAAKKLCRKQPHALIAHTETQLVRAYPAGMRIDSSNFNPVIFWTFGIQMVALNYQTEDVALHLNSAMFEQNGRCGYVPKPAVMRDRSHMMYRRFNPWEKEFDGLHSSQFILNVISGQYVCQGNLACSVLVEVEIFGILVDCNKQKTKIVQRNALNPIWNETFIFQVMFGDLAFIRFAVIDANTNHTISQRIIPLKCLRPGYRHVRLRNAQNQPMPLSTLFIYSRTEEESVGQTDAASDRTKEEDTTKQELRPTGKRRMFFLMVYGVVPDEPYTILKITQESTTQEVVLQALQKSGQSADRVHDYVLVEEVSRGWDKKDREAPSTQRVLDPNECPLQAQAQWTGEGKFLLKRMGDDPSSRAWLSSIRSTKVKQPKTWDEASHFLVCVYNVSPEIPYAILKVPLSANAQDVLAQALVKARRMEEDPNRFVLLEELEWGNGRQQRILPDNENIYRTQQHWQTIGRFILREKEVRGGRSGNLRTATLDRLSKGLSKLPVGEALSDPTAKTKFPLSGLSRTVRDSTACRRQREVHSEGETLSDDEITPDMRTTVSRLKRISLRKVRESLNWKS